MDVHFHDPFHALCDAIDLDHLSRQVILSGDIAERNIQWVSENSMHTAGSYHGSVFIYHINDEHIFLDGCPAQTSADLLKIQHLRQRRTRHNKDSEFRIVPAFRDHITGTEETYLMLFELLHNLLRMFCISTVILR